jgi:hypothetical protein
MTNTLMYPIKAGDLVNALKTGPGSVICQASSCGHALCTSCRLWENGTVRPPAFWECHKVSERLSHIAAPIYVQIHLLVHEPSLHFPALMYFPVPLTFDGQIVPSGQRNWTRAVREQDLSP